MPPHPKYLSMSSARTLAQAAWECSTAELVKKILSILLLAVVGLASATPLLTLAAQALTHGADRHSSLPACCRRNGKHHCTMSLGERSQLAQHGPDFNSSPDKCPYCPGTVAATHADVLAVSLSEGHCDFLVSHPSAVAQTEWKRRISLDRSHQKRGPPATHLL